VTEIDEMEKTYSLGGWSCSQGSFLLLSLVQEESDYKENDEGDDDSND
jgi:hypothetical protein